MEDNIKNSQSKEGLENINILYRDIVDSTSTLIWRTDADGRFTFLNPSWVKCSGYISEEIINRPFSDFQVPGAAEHYINAWIAVTQPQGWTAEALEKLKVHFVRQPK